VHERATVNLDEDRPHLETLKEELTTLENVDGTTSKAWTKVMKARGGTSLKDAIAILRGMIRTTRRRIDMNEYRFLGITHFPIVLFDQGTCICLWIGRIKM
jgi:hypothetical protein